MTGGLFRVVIALGFEWKIQPGKGFPYADTRIMHFTSGSVALKSIVALHQDKLRAYLRDGHTDAGSSRWSDPPTTMNLRLRI